MISFKKRARIVRDTFSGYEVQYKVWWWPFWIQASERGDGVNTHCTIGQAEEFARNYVLSPFVKEVL